MKKIVSVLLAALMLCSCAALASCKKEEAKGKIIVQTNAYFAPFEYYEGTAIVGVDVDIMNQVGTKLNKDIQFNNTEFAFIIDNVAAGTVCDCGAAGITVTDARKEKVDFSDPYYTSVQYVIYKKGSMEISGKDGDVEYLLWNSLAGKKIGVQRDTTGDIYVSDEINANGEGDYDWVGTLNGTGAAVTQYDNAQIAADAIGANQIDVVVVDKLPANYITEKNDAYACAALYYQGNDGAADYPTEESYAICVTKGNTELLNAINDVLKELGNDGIEALVKKHMGITD